MDKWIDTHVCVHTSMHVCAHHAHSHYCSSVGSDPSSATQKQCDFEWVTSLLGISDLSLVSLPLSITMRFKSSWGLTQHLAHVAVVTPLFWKVFIPSVLGGNQRCLAEGCEASVPFPGTACGADLPALRLAYSSVLSHRMIGNCPEKPWGKAGKKWDFSLVDILVVTLNPMLLETLEAKLDAKNFSLTFERGPLLERMSLAVIQDS